MARYAFIRQNDGSDCGAAALATVAKQFRQSLSLEQLRELTGTDRIGTNLLALYQAAQKLGFATKGVHGPFEALAGVPMPCIAHLTCPDGPGHFVVLHKAASKYVIVADPADTHVRKWPREVFCQAWTGNLLLLAPEPNLGRRTPQPLRPWQRFLSLLGDHVNVLLEAFLLAIVVTLLGVGNSYFIQHLVDNVLIRDEVGLLNVLGIGMVLVVLYQTLFGILRQYLMARVGRKVDLALISGYARHLLNLPIKFFEMRRVGEILSRIQDAANVRSAISGTTLTAAVDATMVLIMVVFLWFQDWPLALAATLFIPLLAGGVSAFHPTVKKRSREVLVEGAVVSSHMVEDVTGVETIKAFGAENRRAEEGEDNLVRMVQAAFSLEKANIGMTSVGAAARWLAGLAILWFGGFRVMQGEITIGQLMFFHSMLFYMITPLERLASVNLSLQQALVSVDRLFQILDVELERTRDSRKVQFRGLQHGIELRDVSFRYGCRENVLAGVSLQIGAGERIGLVGESGSGKSTLLKLLMGFHLPTGGSIVIDEVDMHDIDLSTWRQRIGLVSQDVFIFSGSIRHNIALANPSAGMEDVIRAARIAGLHDFISRLPDRYDSLIGERGANLSGGQRQRLSIARALLHQPDILLFDEATSHLDTMTEASVQEALQTVFADRCVVIVAHRLSTIMNADRIYLLAGGQIAEQGSHRELIQQDGAYARLWQKQTGRSVAEVRRSLPVMPQIACPVA